jgi:hypothetical protein
MADSEFIIGNTPDLDLVRILGKAILSCFVYTVLCSRSQRARLDKVPDFHLDCNRWKLAAFPPFFY